MSGMFKSLKSKAQDEDWMGKAKAAATQASAIRPAGRRSGDRPRRPSSRVATRHTSGEERDHVPEGALWRGVSHDAGRNSIVTLYPDRIERTKATSRMSLTGMLAGGP